MDYLVPAIAVVVGIAILAPGVVRSLKKRNEESGSCGGCAGCSNAGRLPAALTQVVQLEQKRDQ